MNTSFFRGKTVLVTGGAGFIGSFLIRRLALLGASVHLLLRPGGDRGRVVDILASVAVHDVDINDTKRTSALLAEVKPSGVFHLAAVSQSFGNIPTFDELVATNILATVKLMDAAVLCGCDFFVNTGTFAEIGSKDHPIREDDILEPKEFYGISRIPATLYTTALGREEGKPFATVRVFTPYGPVMQKGKLVREVIERALHGETIKLTKPEVTRDFIYVEDLVELYLAVAEQVKEFPGRVWNGGSGVATTLEELAQTVRMLTQSKSEIAWSGKEVSYDRARWQADMTKVNRLLSWSPRHDLRAGLEKTIAWYKR